MERRAEREVKWESSRLVRIEEEKGIDMPNRDIWYVCPFLFDKLWKEKWRERLLI